MILRKDCIFPALTIAFILGALFLLTYDDKEVGAAAPAGIQATVATTSLNAVSTTATTVFATSTCAARIVTTTASDIRITFSDYAAQTPTAAFGHLQTASTTVAYDGGIYGCDRMKVYSLVGSNITVTETR